MIQLFWLKILMKWVNQVYQTQNHCLIDKTTRNIMLKYRIMFLISNDLSDCNKKSLREDLQKLIVEQNIAHNTANELLAILRKHGHVDLPKDMRVLLKTPRNASANIKSLGNYIHFGISFTLKRSIQICSKFIKRNEIKLNINIDGLPLSKSSGSQFWPIMASIEDVDVYTSLFIIGIYHGMS